MNYQQVFFEGLIKAASKGDEYLEQRRKLMRERMHPALLASSLGSIGLGLYSLHRMSKPGPDPHFNKRLAVQAGLAAPGMVAAFRRRRALRNLDRKYLKDK